MVFQSGPRLRARGGALAVDHHEEEGVKKEASKEDGEEEEEQVVPKADDFGESDWTVNTTRGEKVF